MAKRIRLVDNGQTVEPTVEEIVLKHEDYEGLDEVQWLEALELDIESARQALSVEDVQILVDNCSGDHTVVPAGTYPGMGGRRIMTHCHSWPDGKTRCPNPAYGHLYADDGKRVPGGGACHDCANEVITGLAKIGKTWTYRPGGLYDGHALIAADSGAPIIHKPATGWAGFIGRVPVACSEPMGIIAKRSSYDSAVYCTACFPPAAAGGRGPS